MPNPKLYSIKFKNKILIIIIIYLIKNIYYIKNH